MYVCMYKGGPYRPLHRDPQCSILLPLSLIIPSAIPHFGCRAGFYTWGRRSSHLVPWDVDPGGEILDKLGPHIHTGCVWLFHFLPDTCHKWDKCPYNSLFENVIWSYIISLQIFSKFFICHLLELNWNGIMTYSECHVGQELPTECIQTHLCPWKDLSTSWEF
jgi:hypothetical protein